MRCCARTDRRCKKNWQSALNLLDELCELRLLRFRFDQLLVRFGERRFQALALYRFKLNTLLLHWVRATCQGRRLLIRSHRGSRQQAVENFG